MSMSEMPTTTTTTPITENEAASWAITVHSANGSTSSTPKLYPSASATYEDVAGSSEIFYDKLREFHHSTNSKLTVPTVGGRALDLHRLFVEVTYLGGVEKVIRDRKWKQIVGGFDFPSTITSASFVLRKYYMLLLYHFEQVYYFRKEVISDDSRNVNESSLEQSAIQFLGQESPDFPIGGSYMGTVHYKFDGGYSVSVTVGSEELTGFLYHHETNVSQNFSELPTQRNRKRSRLALRDPLRPKSNRSGYNFFFAEHYTSLKPLYYGQEREISKEIAIRWNNLSEAQKQVYQQLGMEDKERYKEEMRQYRAQHH